MKFLLVLSLVLSTSSIAMAKDSQWLLCKGTLSSDGSGDTFIINSYEHRDGVTPKGDTKRSADLTFIYGGNILSGKMNSINGAYGNVILKSSNGKSKFTALINLVDEDIYYIKGKLSLENGYKLILNSSLACEELN